MRKYTRLIMLSLLWLLPPARADAAAGQMLVMRDKASTKATNLPTSRPGVMFINQIPSQLSPKDTLVVSRISQRLSNADIMRLKQLIDDGGKVILAMGAGPNAAGVNKILQPLGISFDNHVLSNSTAAKGQHLNIPVYHPDLHEMALTGEQLTVFSRARSIITSRPVDRRMMVIPFGVNDIPVTASQLEGRGRRNEGKIHPRSMLTLAAMVTKPKTTANDPGVRLVVISSGEIERTERQWAFISALAKMLADEKTPRPFGFTQAIGVLNSPEFKEDAQDRKVNFVTKRPAVVGVETIVRIPVTPLGPEPKEVEIGAVKLSSANHQWFSKAAVQKNGCTGQKLVWGQICHVDVALTLANAEGGKALLRIAPLLFQSLVVEIIFDPASTAAAPLTAPSPPSTSGTNEESQCLLVTAKDRRDLPDFKRICPKTTSMPFTAFKGRALVDYDRQRSSYFRILAVPIEDFITDMKLSVDDEFFGGLSFVGKFDDPEYEKAYQLNQTSKVLYETDRDAVQVIETDLRGLSQYPSLRNVLITDWDQQTALRERAPMQGAILVGECPMNPDAVRRVSMRPLGMSPSPIDCIIKGIDAVKIP
jgi:hypothetical protein